MTQIFASLIQTFHISLTDDWEADTLTKKQVTYAAADSAVALDIFLALCSKQTLGSPVNIAECDVSVETLQTYIDEHCSR